MSGYTFGVRHGHVWDYLPTLDSNPEVYARVCRICGETQTREGVTVMPNGPSIPGTPWRTVPPSE